MNKKKNPEQEIEQPVEEQDQETEAGTEETDEEAQEQETAPEAEEEAEDPAEDSEQPEKSEEEQPADDQQEGTPAAGSDENAALQRELLQARGELAAYRAGVAPGMVADTVTLAMAEAARSGEVTEAAVTKAVEAVLKRHPEWKAQTGNAGKGGFKLGADRDSGNPSRKNANQKQNVKRWNRFK